VGVLLCFLLGAYFATSLIFARESVFLAAPEGSVMAVKVFTSGSRATHVVSALQHTPLITGKSLTVIDILPYTRGEFALFLNTNGETSIALKIKNEQNLPNFFDKNMIYQQRVGKNTLLLSQTPQKISPISMKRSFLSFTSLLPGRSFGEILDLKTMTRSQIFTKNHDIVIRSRKSAFTGEKLKTLPSGTTAYLSNPALPKMPTEYLTPFLPTLFTLQNSSLVNFLQRIPFTNGLVYLVKKEGITSFFLSQEESADRKIDLEDAMRTITSIGYPIIEKNILDDGSSIQEILIDKNLFSIEKITLFGDELYRSKLFGVNFFGGQINKNHIFFTNNESLLREVKSQEMTDPLICHGNVGGMIFEPFILEANNMTQTPMSAPILYLAQNFSSIGLENGFFFQKIHLCK